MKKIFLMFLLCLCQSLEASVEKRSLKAAIIAAQAKDYEKASVLFYELSHAPRYAKKKLEIKYLLGLMLYQMDLNQLAAYQFIPIIKSKSGSRLLQKSLEKMAVIADTLEDDTILNYSMSKVTVSRFPKSLHNLLFFRIGQFQMRNRQYEDAIRSLRRVSLGSKYYGRAKYSEGLSYAELNRNQQALRAFQQLVDYRKDTPINDSLKVAAHMGQARVLYQAKKWEGALRKYKNIPKDTALWHDTFLESSWSFLRSGSFRSALSNFQTIHSPFYEDFYIPESLLLRSIVYLYICQYEEAKKVLTIFEKDYMKMYNHIKMYLNSEKKLINYYKFIERFMRGQNISSLELKLPSKVAFKISKEGDFLSAHNYVGNLIQEIERTKVFSPRWKKTSLGRYTEATLKRRLRNAQIKAGRIIKRHVMTTKLQLEEFFEQKELIQFDLIKSQREKYAKKQEDKKKKFKEAIDFDKGRDFYVQKGYDYWPFESEYWLDELGSYYYLGTHTCRDY